MWFENSIPSSKPLHRYHTPQKIEQVQFATENEISPKSEASFILGLLYTAILLDKKPFEWKAALHVTRPIKAGRGAP